jgi:tetratricopeptide (TPR) repeat protein
VRRASPGGEAEYLAQWNERWQAFHFVGGHKRPGESFRNCCVRETEEELHLTAVRQFRVAAEPLAHLAYVAFSHGAGAETAYTIELFDVELLQDTAALVAADPANRWLSEADIRARRCRDGRTVSDTMLRVLALAGLTPGEFDLFVSYAHKDDAGGWVSALVEALRAEHAQFTNVPLRIFFDRAAIHDMDDWEHRILTGLRSARVMLAVLSPDYVASTFCRREWDTYVEHELALTLPGDGIAPVYTVTVPEFEADEAGLRDDMLRNARRRQYVDARPWFAEGVSALRREEVRRRLQELDARIDERLRRAGQAAASTAFRLPAHNRNFVGRHDELRQLREIVACGRVGAIAAVQGFGGIGKTALAYEFAHAFAEQYPGGRFVLRAEGVADFRAAVVDQLRAELGVELSDDEKRSYELSFPRVWNVLKGHGRSLLVLDNLDQVELLTGAKRLGVLPAGDAVHVAVTTRLEPERLEDRELIQCLRLEALPSGDGLQLLRRFRTTSNDDEWKAAVAIVNRLGGHALALEVVGVFLWKNPDVSYGDYMARLEAEGIGAVEVAAEVSPVELISRHPEKHIGRLLEPTLVTLSPPELRALEYAAQLPADTVPLLWLRALLERHMPEAMRRQPGYPDPWMQVERRLDGLRLVVKDPKEPRLGRMHRVVRDVVVARMGREAAAERQNAATEYAMERAKFLCDGWVHREARWEIEPVYFHALQRLGAGDISGPELANEIQHPMWLLGRLSAARELLRRAIAIGEKAHDADHPTLAVSYSNLATVEQDLGNLGAARELLRRAIAIDEKAYDADHPNLAMSYWNLSNVEQSLDNLPKARALVRRAFAILRARLGDQHRNTQLARGWLAANNPDFTDADLASDQEPSP